jgi:hypothetical protein
MKDGLQLIYRTQTWQLRQAYSRGGVQPYDATSIVHSPHEGSYKSIGFLPLHS